MTSPASLLRAHHRTLWFALQENQDEQRRVQEMREASDRVYLSRLDTLREDERELLRQLDDVDEAMESELQANKREAGELSTRRSG